MAQHNNGNNSASQQLVKPVFHDFLCSKPNDSLVVFAPKTTTNMRLSDASPSSASMSVAASSGGGGRGPFSTTSDIGSERQVGNHLEGVPFYGPRSDFSDTGLSNRLIGNKRSTSESAFMGSSRDAFQMVPDSMQNSHLMKMFWSTAGGEHRRRSNDDEVFLGMQTLKPTSASQIFQPLTGTKFDANRWERSVVMNVGPSMQHPPRGAQVTPFAHQIASNKARETNVGPSFISQSAADEGSRTGMKGTGILSSMNITTAATDKTSSAVVLGGGRPKPVMNVIDLESSTPSQHDSRSASCQMTIFYGGQAHVFDNVHPNKADVIMSLAGSNGGSWSTSTCSAKPPLKQLLHDSAETPTGKLHAIPSADHHITAPPPPPPGRAQASVAAKEDSRRNHPVEVAERDPISQEKRAQ